MSDWLETARRVLSEALGAPLDALSQNEIEELLDLARVAAHDSGVRTNAPLVCYLIGLTRGQHPELSVSELADAVIRANSTANN